MLQRCMVTVLTVISCSAGLGSRCASGAVQPAGAAVGIDSDAVGVRILLGVDDKGPTRWDGTVRLSAGEIVRIEPWRSRPGDEVHGVAGWKATSYQLNNPLQGTPRRAPTGVVLTVRAAATAHLEVETAQGAFRLPLEQVKRGVRLPFLGGRVLVDGIVPATPITAGDTEDDFPAATPDLEGGVWVAYVAHTHRGPADLQSYATAPDTFQSLVPAGGGDQIMLLHFDGKRWSEPIAGSEPGLDLWRPAVQRDRLGIVYTTWSQNHAGNWDLQHSLWPMRGRSEAPAQRPSFLAPASRLTNDPGTDTAPALTFDRDGRLWIAWQGWRDGRAVVWLRRLPGGPDPGAAAVPLTDPTANAWSPDIAADSKGRVHVAYDTYQAGTYDVYLRTMAGATLSEPVAVASSSRFEGRPSLVCDSADRVWIAYEQRAADWGKDFGPLAPVQGSPLYMRGSSVQVRCLADGRLLRPATELTKNFPDDLKRFNSLPRLGLDGRGRLWLLFRHRHEAIWGANPTALMVGGVWLEYATSFDGTEWTAPALLASSDNILDVRPALVRTGSGRLMAIYPSDGRLRREVLGSDEQRKVFFTGGGVTVSGQAKNRLYAAWLPDLGPAGPAQLEAVPADRPGPAGPAADVPAARGATALDPDPEPAALHANAAADLRRIRDYRIEAGGKRYQLLRGEFHRHTELSMDGGEDGSLEDMWRYAIDAADLDWIGNGDHDSGGGREYPWWIIQKTTDLFHHAPRFVPMFTFERSVPYPNGHRNVMFDRRGIRTLPRLVGSDPGGVSPDDTKMLYRYLRELGGICASHTSGTGMGTDWRDNDPLAEPLVEIYQGDRNSYEALGGPRVARKQTEAYGGWRPLGMVWNAMALGHKFGFQASSDHWSTHISYAIALSERRSRSAILDAFKRRHCYGATDNIVLDVRLGEAIMGDEITLRDPKTHPPTLAVTIHGTAPLQRVDLIKDFVYAYTAASKEPSLRFHWTDDDPRPGLSWYYVRVLQVDGQVAWGSPIWVRVPPRP